LTTLTAQIAGHETTSGTLSFLFYHLLKNPNKYHKAQKEVDQVLGDDAITLQHLPKLKYVDACIKEALRFQGPITAFSRHCKKKTDILAGKYPIDTDKIILVNLRGLHHDPAVWGNDHDQYVPERMLEFDKIPPGAFKPFGTGMRACIGRAFSEQEMLIIVALILQRFQVDMADPSYNLGM
jgi:cytochrome P450/NADPH-cytochrome P450 reductase